MIGRSFLWYVMIPICETYPEIVSVYYTIHMTYVCYYTRLRDLPMCIIGMLVHLYVLLYLAHVKVEGSVIPLPYYSGVFSVAYARLR